MSEVGYTKSRALKIAFAQHSVPPLSTIMDVPQLNAQLKMALYQIQQIDMARILTQCQMLNAKFGNIQTDSSRALKCVVDQKMQEETRAPEPEQDNFQVEKDTCFNTAPSREYKISIIQN